MVNEKKIVANYAKSLLPSVTKFDGKTYNEKGEKVNIKKVLGEVEEIIKKEYVKTALLHFSQSKLRSWS